MVTDQIVLVPLWSFCGILVSWFWNFAQIVMIFISLWWKNHENHWIKAFMIEAFLALFLSSLDLKPTQPYKVFWEICNLSPERPKNRGPDRPVLRWVFSRALACFFISGLNISKTLFLGLLTTWTYRNFQNLWPVEISTGNTRIDYYWEKVISQKISFWVKWSAEISNSVEISTQNVFRVDNPMNYLRTKNLIWIRQIAASIIPYATWSVSW